MTIRDPGPIYNLGFGVTSRQHLRSDGDENRDGVNPESGMIAKELHDNPVMRFFAVSAATLVGMAVGGSMLRRGGVKLGKALQDSNAPWTTNLIRDFRQVQKQMDAWQGIKRTLADETDESILFLQDPEGRLHGDTIEELRGFFFTKTERERAIRLGHEIPAEWSLNQEIQQRMVRQARRLPYELPAAYAVQRGITDRVFGQDDPRDQVNWKNPFDVITDFVATSVKNTAFMVAPFEVGVGSTRQTWRKMMTYGDDLVNLTPNQRDLRNASVSLRTVLGQVGADATDIINRTVQVSSQVTGSFSAGLNAAREDSIGLVQFLHKMRSGSLSYSNQMSAQRLGKVLRSHEFQNLGPGPFNGLGSGVRGFNQAWREIGESNKAFQEMMQLGRNKFELHASQEAKQALYRAMGRGAHPIEELSGKLHDLARGGPQMGGSWRGGEFYRGQFQNEYMKLLQRRLTQMGVSDEAANKFSRIARVAPPSQSSAATHIQRRLMIHGGDPLLGSTTEEVYDDLMRNLGWINHSERQMLRHQLPQAIESVDDLFKTAQFRDRLDKKIGSQWSLFERKVLPEFGGEILKTSRMPYEDFTGNLSNAQKQFLRRKSAHLTGLRMVEDTGEAVSDQIVHDQLRRVGLDPANFDQLRGYLTTKGAIGKPWTREGRNVFGLRGVTIGTALDRGHFRQGPGLETEIKRLSARIAQQDPISSIGQYNIGGMYETSAGQIIDFSPIKRGATKFMDTLASEFHVPLVKFNPLRLFGYSAKMEAREKAVLQYIPSMSNQAFLAGQKANDDFYMWMRQAGRGNKGRVFGFTGDKFRRFEGLYSAQSSVGGWHARNARLAIGESGLVPKVNAAGETVDEGRWSNLKRTFDVSDNQPDSFFGYANRFLRRKEDLNNPLTFSKLLTEGQIQTRKGTIRLSDLSDEELTRSFDRFSSHIRRFGFSDKVLDTVRGGDPRFRGMSTYDFRGRDMPETFLPGKNGMVNIADLKTPAQINEAIELILSKDSGMLNRMPKDVRAAMRRAQDSLLARHIEEASGPSYWDKQLPQNARSATVHTRLDRAKQDIYRYLSLRTSITRGEDFNEFVPELLQRMQRQRMAGQLSQAEFTEARAAVLSMQVEYQAFATYSAQAPHTEHVKNMLEGLLSGPGAASAKSVTKDISRGYVGVSEGKYGYVQPALRRAFGIADYNYAGTRYNPFGDNTMLVPTWGTVWSRNSMDAILGAVGIKTWNNPANYSAGSIPISHMFERVNRFFSAVGLQLQPHNYKGPLDFYGKGIIGRRVLPAVGGFAGFMTVDRTIGGLVNEKDQSGNRVYSPFFTGIAAGGVAKGQIALSALVPGGQTGAEKAEELYEGEVAIRSGRWWPLGNTPWRGGRISYYRPSWYRRLKAGALYQDQTFGSPLERLAFGYDFSPLRPLDPYHYERKHYDDRPYPVTGEYFTGPWGPLTGALNMTLGKIMKPQVKMHRDELKAGLAAYQPVGEFGAFLPYDASYGGSGGAGGAGVGSGGGSAASNSAGYAGAQLSQGNANLASAGRISRATASNATAEAISGINNSYIQAAYGTPAVKGGGFDPRIIAGTRPAQPSDLAVQSSQLGYQLQELFGIYGFGFGAVRTNLGFGNQDLSTTRPVLESAGDAYGAARGFWDLNLGGLGDAPLPIEGPLSNLEFSEIARRFVPRQRSDIERLNPIPNSLAETAPWLPGSDYFINFLQGDPYTKVQEGELRLPGQGYERLHGLHPDLTGSYGVVDQHKILGDVAPWSNQYKAVDRLIGSGSDLGSEARAMVETTREQVAAKSQRHEFTPYKYKYMGFEEAGMHPISYAIGRAVEEVSHADSYFNTKFLPTRTAVEDWERQNVYGATFPQWQKPIEDFVKPLVYRSTQRNPIQSALVMGGIGALFGATPRARMVGSAIGAIIGGSSSLAGNAYELFTGNRFIPQERRRQIALEEYTDILTYVKNMHLYNQALMSGDRQAANNFKSAAQQTMYGTDVYNTPLDQLSLAVPRRKREHFEAMLTAPEQEREQILSTAGRLERRLLQGAWGMQVERRPDLVDYFSKHELPGPGWEGWHPNTNMEHVKIKMGQSLGIEMSEMGYYPQQVREANLINPSYPDFTAQTGRSDVRQEIRRFLQEEGLQGNVYPVKTPFPGTRLEIQSGVF